MNLKNFFNPHSIAVIGASNDKNKVGYALVFNLLRGAKRDIYPVSLTEKEILGLKAYASIKEITGNIDLALIAVRADIVPSILEDCATKGIHSVIIIAAGFKETGAAGALLEKKVTEIAGKNEITLLGPNCLGTIDTKNDFNASFAAGNPKKGRIAFLSQSGALGTGILDKATAEGIGFSKFISLGNEAALSEIEFLEYLKNDEETGAILMYVERLSNGAEFMRLAGEITKNKPIVLIKAGRGERGQQAVMSHTGSLAPEDKIFSAACKQAGIIVVESIREFFNLAKLFELGIFKPLQKLIVLTNAGGPAVVTADFIDFSRSLSLLELSDKTKEQLKKVLPPMAGVNNPVDIIGDALSDRYEAALKILVEEKDAAAIIVILTPQMMTQAEATAELLVKYNSKKIIIPVFMGGPFIEKSLAILREHNLVNFAFPKDAVEALDNIAKGAGKDEAKKTLKMNPSADSRNLKMLPFREAGSLFSEYNLVCSGVLAAEKSELESAMQKIGGDSFILKLISPDVVHKTDMGAVKLNIKTPESAVKAWDEMLKNVYEKKPNAVIEGVLVQATTQGKEVIIGMKRDPVFGPTILFGLGGIFTEVLKDTSLRIAPISKESAAEMIHEIRGIDILTGRRGEKPVDITKLADIIVKISKLAVEHPEIKEVDLNPVMAQPDGADIIDVRIMI
jgi:acetyltransferase